MKNLVIRKDTTVMVEEGVFGTYFKCSECGGKADRTGWKFCAYCGAEIVRWQKQKVEYEDVNLVVNGKTTGKVRVGKITHTIEATCYKVTHPRRG